jgi:hypothetical protein
MMMQGGHMGFIIPEATCKEVSLVHTTTLERGSEEDCALSKHVSMDERWVEGSTKEVSLINTVTLERDSMEIRAPNEYISKCNQKSGCKRWMDAGLIIY